MLKPARVTQLISKASRATPSLLQPRLAIGPVDDPYEREAERVAEQVMRMPVPSIQRCSKCAGKSAELMCPSCKAKALAEQGTLQRAPDGAAPEVTPDVEGQIGSLRGGGQPLDGEVRRFMEPRFGYDFGGVRVHTGPQAARAASSVSALAFTLGNDVVFGAGQYQPSSPAGQRLIAHELTHVVQQGIRGTISAQRTPGKTADSSTDTAASASETAPAAQSSKAVISPEIEKSMKADVERIVALLREQVMDAGEEQEALSLVERWAEADTAQGAQDGNTGSKHLDKFLFLLKTRVYSRRTARSMWVEQWSNAYDDLWHELEGARLTRFQQIVSTSRKQATAGPTSERMESAYSYIGKREAMGALGISKALSTGLASAADAAIWVGEKVTGAAPSPRLADTVGKGFDEMADLAASGMGVDRNEKLLMGMSSYQFGATWGQVPAALMMGGALSKLGVAQKAAMGIVQALKSVDDLAAHLRQLRKGPPPRSWKKITKDPYVWAQVVGVVSGVCGAAGGLGGATSRAAVVLGKLDIPGNLSQIALLAAAYHLVDEDAALSNTEKARRKGELLAEMATTGALTINARYGEDFEHRWAQRAHSNGEETKGGSSTDTISSHQNTPPQEEKTVTSAGSDHNERTASVKAAQSPVEEVPPTDPPYNPHAWRAYLEQKYGAQNVKSSTVPPSNAPGVRYTRNRHPTSGVPYDARGFPIFDDYAKVEVQIPSHVAAEDNPRKHMRAATMRLREDIERGAINSNIFTPEQLAAIGKGREKNTRLYMASPSGHRNTTAYSTKHT